MHRLLYVCLPRSQARTSLQARKKVCEYLTAEGFDTHLRFSGCCDYFMVGGRWSGDLSLLRLKYVQPKLMARFWKRHEAVATGQEAEQLFRGMFPDFRGRIPVGRNPHGRPQGYPDDAQFMDEPLFEQLKNRFSDEVKDGGDVIFTTDCYCQEPDGDFPWPQNGAEGAKFWVVVIDYHF
ncbi:MAG TPA: hypothetical protein VH575_26830 [Gemmataceae bacterium]|jgi:hypothetical protein